MKKSVNYAIFGGAVLLCLLLMVLSFIVPNGYFYLYKVIGIYSMLLFGSLAYFGITYYWNLKKESPVTKQQESLDDIKNEMIVAIREGDEEKMNQLREILSKIRSASNEVETVRYQTKRKMFGRPRGYSHKYDQPYKDFYLDVEVSSEISDEDSREMEELLKKYMPPSITVPSDIKEELPPISLED